MPKLIRNPIVFSIAYSLLILVILEIVLRILGIPKPPYQTHTHPPQFQRVSDPAVLYVNLPSTSINFIYEGNPRGYFKGFNLVDQVTNRFGFRGPEFATTKPAGTFRILFLGDSFTFGEGVYLADTYPEQFLKIANADKLPGGRKFEAINLGVGGYNTSQEWALLDSFGEDLKPDALVVGYVLNDAEPYLFYPLGDKGLGRIDRESKVPENTALNLAKAPILTRISVIYRIIWQAAETRARARQTIAYYHSLYEDGQDGWQKTRTSLKNLSEFGRQNKIPVVIVIFPILYNLDENYPFLDIHQKLRQELTADGLTYVDLLDNLAGKYRGAELWVHPTDQHPNEIVHRLAAEALARKFAVLGITP